MFAGQILCIAGVNPHQHFLGDTEYQQKNGNFAIIPVIFEEWIILSEICEIWKKIPATKFF